jgi:hypothetical protein
MIRHLFSLLSPLLLLGACGDDDGGPPPVNDPDADWPVVREWGAGAQFGYASVSIRTKLPSDLTMRECLLDAQLATATAGGMLPQTDAEGECIVTSATDFVGLSPDPAPACAGTIRFVRNEENTNYVVCADSDFPNTFDIDCGELTGVDELRVTSADDGVEGDILLSLDLAVSRPDPPTITVPMPQGPGSALWPDGTDLHIEWVTAEAGAVEIVLGPTVEGGERVRCLTADDGEFDMPARLVQPYRAANAAVEIHTINQIERDVDGFAFRLSYSVSDAIQLVAR